MSSISRPSPTSIKQLSDLEKNRSSWEDEMDEASVAIRVQIDKVNRILRNKDEGLALIEQLSSTCSSILSETQKADIRQLLQSNTQAILNNMFSRIASDQNKYHDARDKLGWAYEEINKLRKEQEAMIKEQKQPLVEKENEQPQNAINDQEDLIEQHVLHHQQVEVDTCA